MSTSGLISFTPAPPTDGLPAGRLVSQDEIWEMGVYPVIFGYRVRLGKVGAVQVALDYCCGDNMRLVHLVYIAVRHIMEAHRQSITPAEVALLFPDYERRPIDQDPCLKNLLELACKFPKAQSKEDSMRDLTRIDIGVQRWLSSSVGLMVQDIRLAAE